MKIAIIIRNVPVPLYSGLNVIIQNIVKNISRNHQLQIFVLDENDFSKINDVHFNKRSIEIFHYNNNVNNYKQHTTFKINKILRFYRIEEKKIIWLTREIAKYKPDSILGFGYDLLGYFGLLNAPIPKILNIIDDETLFLWRDIKKGNIGINKLKHLIASISYARKYIKKCNAIITVSSEDTDHIKSLSNFQKVYTIPNGVDTDFYYPDNAVEKVNGQIIFAGSMNWPPNQQAVQWFLKNCWHIILESRPDAALIIIGKWLKDDLKLKFDKYKNVTALGFVEDLRNFVRASQVSIAPMISGSGIKNKILEAWALGNPVVATSLGARGLIYVDEKNILLADTPSLFANQVLKLLNNADLREMMGEKGRRNAIENYSWQIATNRLIQIMEEISSLTYRYAHTL
jgi:glycosyltransferase involved in cell wall biosynthesis